MAPLAQKKMVAIPLPVFETAETKEELEEWLLANDPTFVREMERIRTEETGKGISLHEAAKKWRIGS